MTKLTTIITTIKSTILLWKKSRLGSDKHHVVLVKRNSRVKHLHPGESKSSNLGKAQDQKDHFLSILFVF